MALPSSGPLSINDIAVEFGGSVPHFLSEYYGVAAGVPASGTIAITHFYGKSNDASISATGGTISDSGGYRYHTFTSGGTFTVNSAASGAFSNTINTLILAAGGGVHGNDYMRTDGCGGGGGGGMVETSFSASAGSKTVSVGQPVNFRQGGNSSVTGLTTAVGGGYGGPRHNIYDPRVGGPGGSGGGGAESYIYGSGTAGQGNRGGDGRTGNMGRGGGGGGAGAAGGDAIIWEARAPSGGSGKAWLNGVTYAGGGGGGADGPYWSGYGGSGGGGTVGNGTFYGGGAGAGSYSVSSSYGYQGIVIFRYQI